MGTGTRAEGRNGRPPKRVLLVEGSPLMRAGLRLLLESGRGTTVTADCGQAGEAISRAGRRDWDILVLDFDLPGGDGLDLIRTLRKAAGRRALLVLSNRPEEVFGAQALRAGADGFLPKTADPAELFRAVERVAAGGRYVSPALGEALAFPPRRGRDGLSERELQVLCGIACGHGGKELAQRLRISPKTVCTYRSRLLVKLRLKSNADLVRYVLEAGLEGRSSAGKARK